MRLQSLEIWWFSIISFSLPNILITDAITVGGLKGLVIKYLYSSACAKSYKNCEYVFKFPILRQEYLCICLWLLFGFSLSEMETILRTKGHCSSQIGWPDLLMNSYPNRRVLSSHVRATCYTPATLTHPHLVGWRGPTQGRVGQSKNRHRQKIQSSNVGTISKGSPLKGGWPNKDNTFMVDWLLTFKMG